MQYGNESISASSDLDIARFTLSVRVFLTKS